ncbi:hypothetical protein CHRY9390_01702 [Chryseobacterium aquaeductus]|uniref:DUF4349 domain-containing protein n=1 Tax=Chryseobacterium aquaeductus TaxID=2675056 RepID=A0A9N8MH15_9FLAO|nr:DUF4349 domain-containing protein [Chryseobacterium aquaeductus]CAA7331022.1 hypothetical protein CHRY9390_01702 [Chryseobacterium potabilaquae]CAD7807709.1 hypothetical protein CHRY9390_01702 [Chryseobacterium aquaeductus]
MKTTHIKLTLATAIFLGIFSCKKGEASVNEYSTAEYNNEIAADSVSSVATMSVKDKQFIKTASVNMEVKDVYQTTISVEKSVQELGGFVTHSNLHSNVISEETFNTSDDEAMLVKKYQTENTLQVRVPTQKLSKLLTLINDKKLFLNSRIINAEDVTANIKYAELEGKRIKKTSENISELKNTKDKVNMSDENMSEENQQQLANMDVADNLKYSTVDIYIKEPQLRIAEIAITNTQNIDNKYKFNFLYDVKNAFVEGFYLIQKILVGLVTIWPIALIAGVAFYFYRKTKSNKKSLHTTED